MASPLKLHGNPEHAGITTAIPLILVAATILSYFVLAAVVPPWFGGTRSEFFVVNAVLAVLLGLAAISVADPLLKRVWHSGHEVDLPEGGVVYRPPAGERGRSAARIDLRRPYKLVCWQFKMSGYARFGRERQIPGGHYTCACLIQQEDERLVLHSFVSPGKVADVTAGASFAELNMEKLFDKSLSGRVQQWRSPATRPQIPSNLVVSDNGPYWLAERSRWERGVELKPPDFEKLMNHLLQYQDQAVS